MEIERELHTIEVSDKTDHPDIKTIQQNLVKYCESHVGPSTYRELVLSVRDKRGDLIAGLNGQSNWQWLFVKLLWVAEGHRYHGLGTRLLKAAEQEASRRSCTGVWLDTFSFQSPGFYKKHAYTELGAIDNYPYGHKRSFFYRRL